MYEIQFVRVRKHYVSSAKVNMLMLFGETNAVYCEKYTKRTQTLPVEFWVLVC
jgi:thioredoxin-related protein